MDFWAVKLDIWRDDYPIFFSLSGQNFRKKKKEISIHLMNSPAKIEQSVTI